MKRSERIVAMTHHFKENPRKLISLPYFVDSFQAAKSSVSEDIDIIDEMFQSLGIGRIETTAGASGGVRYIPDFNHDQGRQFIDRLIHVLEDPNRILPGGYVYMSDILGDYNYIRETGKVFGAAFKDVDLDYIVTVATKGIPLAYAVAEVLNVPVVIIRRDPKVTEGSTVSINYVSGSSRKIQTMALAKRSIQEESNVLLIDDFMKAGGTIKGMENLMQEFNATVKGIAVLAEAEDEDEERRVEDYVSLLKIQEVNERSGAIKVIPGNYFNS
ncbi:pur operon repressor [Alkalibacillus haloalkaliphilus]|uniref:Pur operon repressor n=1 Tax=Alkalibacillus haloalkaliphilus TaxID=94136 RepID=A0A511W0V8_9BACI|nr:pur operon repressor [Alkalibacillus haloalkaliphilus]GEN44730.1 pur operon repressor [Alkalibacillus haloalkaliphilus]